MNSLRRSDFKEMVLKTAGRHLTYVSRDQELGLEGKGAKRLKVLDFYASLLTNARMSEEIQDLYKLAEGIDSNSQSREKRYQVEEVFSVLGVKDNVSTFRALQHISPLIRRETANHRTEFLVEQSGVESLVTFLNEAKRIDYSLLGGLNL